MMDEELRRWQRQSVRVQVVGEAQRAAVALVEPEFFLRYHRSSPSMLFQ
jgi:hypothetical protein